MPITTRQSKNGILSHSEMDENFNEIFPKSQLFDENGKIKATLMPKITITDTFDVNNETQMLGLTCEKGDMARRMDFTPPKMYVLQGDNPAVLSNWIELTVSTDVTATINSQKGIAGGLLPLNSSAKIDLKYLPDGLSAPVGSTDVTTTTTRLLLHFNGNNNDSNFIDEVGHVFTKVGTPVLSNVKSKFGNTSLYLDGNSYISSALSDLTSVTNFSIEFFYYPIFNGKYWVCSFNNNAIRISIEIGTTGPQLYLGSTNLNLANQIATDLTLNQWHHIAIIRNNGTVKVFLNGELKITSSNSSVINLSNFVLGSNFDGTFKNKCYIDELRITTSISTSQYTVPTAEYAS